MTTAQLKQIAKAKFETISTQDLIATLKQYNNDFRDGVEIAIDAITDILIVRLPENEFVELCNSL